MTLTSKQRAFLNSQAHSLKPIIQIGKNGLNDQIKTSVRQALDARELIKVTLLQNTDENIHEVAEILEEEIGVDTVQKIGPIGSSQFRSFAQSTVVCAQTHSVDRKSVV